MTPGEPVGQSQRRFLRPLVGLDPAEVRLHRGETAARLTAAQHADALTHGRDVFFAPGQGGDDPRGVALLAHELTHVAQQREPTFVPPIARSAYRSGADDAEDVATRVESRARTAAEQPTWPGQPQPAWPAQPQPTGPAQPRPEPTGVWAGLPAPWEALPDWLTTPPAGTTGDQLEGHTAAIGPGHTGAHAGTVSPSTNGSPGNAANGQATALYAADIQRDVPVADTLPPTPGQSSETGTSGHHDQAQPEPDLDALSRQVYTVLRRRMASERRRFS